ncbi:MAG TPA: right-handed parallel beta-helix repeat-containing protein, partial [Nitrospiraceae bacterium]|nr:right-handed parallel beta-helix repeat-containing protein [Nitrospiraceae bacterium]
MQWAGIYLEDCTQCIVADNHIFNFAASIIADKADIVIYKNCSFNTVRGNRCFGGENAVHGILIQDPGGAGTFLPQHNKIVDNWIGDHTGYGIALYVGGIVDSFNQIIGNTIQNITGTYLDGKSGTGIYCVGGGIGGVQVVNNVVRSCCLKTKWAENGPGGITIADSALGTTRAVVTGNTVQNMVQASGILIVDAMAGAIVSNNSIRMPDTNIGNGPGGDELVGAGIRIHDSSDVDVTGNTVLHSGRGDAFLAIATTSSFDRINVSGNLFRAAIGHALRIDRTSGYVHTDCVVSGNQMRTDGTQAAMFLVGTDRVAITGNNGGAN